MTEEFYKEINIDAITPDLFPDVAVYLKTSATNYMLYKPHGRKLTTDDLDRLKRRASDYIYVRTGDMEEVTAYQEQNLTHLLQRKDLKSLVKGTILFQICADYVVEIIESPQKVREVERCRNLVRQMIWFVSHDKDAVASLKVIAAANPYQIAHSVQVAALSMLMHTRIFPDITGDSLENAGIGAILLDLGIALGKNEKSSSSDHEYQVMKQHATLGYDFLNRTGVFSDITLAVVHHHHERFDGKGYPHHLKEDDLPKSVQIATLCDSLSSLTLDRGYRKAVTTEQALHNMSGLKGAHDPGLFHSFEKIIREVRY